MNVTTKPRRVAGGLPRWAIAMIGAVIVLAAIVLVVRQSFGGSQGAAPATVAVRMGSITATVDGIGTIGAAQTIDLVFQRGGEVAEVFVKSGDTLSAGQPIARVDDRALKAAVVREQAGLDAARARLAQAQSGNAKAADLASARAQLDSAKASYAKIAAGPSDADVASAEAALRSAMAKLDTVVAGATASDLEASQASIRSAESQLAQAEQKLAETKALPKPEDIRAAEFALEQAKNQLWSQQSSRDLACGRAGKDSPECSSGDAAVGASDVAVRSAVDKLNQAKQPASDEEINSAEQAVRSALASVASAVAKLDHVEAGPSEADRQVAQSQVDQAQASLDKVRSSITTNDVAAARAGVNQAQANLDKLTAAATQTDLIIQVAGVTQSEQALVQAQLNLETATLKAPFDGIVSLSDIGPGSLVNVSSAVGSLVDRGTPHIDLKLSENDVLKVELGQPVILTHDALSGWSAEGKVSYIAPAAETISGVTTYAVRATFDDDDVRLRVGMTTNISIMTAQKDGILLVPNSALLPKGAGRIVQQMGPDVRTVGDVDVRTGITDGTMTEIVGGLGEGELIIASPSIPGANPAGGFFGAQ